MCMCVCYLYLYVWQVRSPTARTLLLLADETTGLLRGDTTGKLRVVNTGVRLFEREEAFDVLPNDLAAVQAFMASNCRA